MSFAKHPSADRLKDLLRLAPHLREGGWFRQTYVSAERIPQDVLPGRYSGERAAGTAIYYLLTPDTFSEMHRLASDEVFHFYVGDPIEMLQLKPGGQGEIARMGSDIEGGMTPQLLVPQGVWQGSRLIAGGEVALLGCTVSPGFDYADYEQGTREQLTAEYPAFAEMIRELTRA
jgi:predicted cupin superfamily sugar epimerase